MWETPLDRRAMEGHGAECYCRDEAEVPGLGRCLVCSRHRGMGARKTCATAGNCEKRQRYTPTNEHGSLKAVLRRRVATCEKAKPLNALAAREGEQVAFVTMQGSSSLEALHP